MHFSNSLLAEQHAGKRLVLLLYCVIFDVRERLLSFYLTAFGIFCLLVSKTCGSANTAFQSAWLLANWVSTTR